MQVNLVDYMGSDLTVVNAARVSFGKKKLTLDSKDEKLIEYLAKHNHWTPFAHCTVQFHIKAPIYVARQLVKHQVGLVWNEVSRRYVDAVPEFEITHRWRGRPVDGMKQGSSGMLDPNLSAQATSKAAVARECCQRIYNELLALGVAPEMARMVLPLNTMTEWYWTGSLAAWARVCNLRLAKEAQVETRYVAEEISKVCSMLFPTSWTALRGKKNIPDAAAEPNEEVQQISN